MLIKGYLNLLFRQTINDNNLVKAKKLIQQQTVQNTTGSHQYKKNELVAAPNNEQDNLQSDLEKEGLKLLTKEDLIRIEKRFEKRRELLTEQCKLQRNKVVTNYEGIFNRFTVPIQTRLVQYI